MRPALIGLLLLSGCSVVKSARVRDDYAQVDSKETKRLVLVTQLDESVEPKKLGELYSRIARRYVNQKRNFIVARDVAAGAAPDRAQLCAKPEGSEERGFEGLLWLSPSAKPEGKGVEMAVDAKLLRCRDGEEVWAASAAGSFASEDSKLVEVAASYAQEYGAEVTPYVAPAMNLLRPLLDTLPDPAPPANDEEFLEKQAADE
jgi:probable lipoprotein (TIGR04455 family)